MNLNIRIVANAEELSLVAAGEFIRHAIEATQTKGSFTVALSGGSTPKSLYALLANDASFRAAVPWDKVHFFWGDERHVPPDHANSNYRMAREAMLAKVPIPLANVHRIQAENPDASQAAAAYEQTLQQCFRVRDGQVPRFDLVLLGMGPDGHTASLFPGTAALREHKRLVTANWVEKFDSYRITLTASVLNNATCVIFLVSGGEKAEMLKTVLHGKRQPERFPAQLIQPTHGTLLWLVDRPAARLLA